MDLLFQLLYPGHSWPKEGTCLIDMSNPGGITETTMTAELFCRVYASFYKPNEISDLPR